MRSPTAWAFAPNSEPRGGLAALQERATTRAFLIVLGCATFVAAGASAASAAAPGPIGSAADDTTVRVLGAAARAAADSSSRTDSLARAALGDSLALADSTAALPLRFEVAAELVSNGARSGVLVEPAGMTTDAFGRIWIGDAAQHRVVRFDAQGRLQGQSGTLGSGAGELRHPAGVALIGTLQVAVLDLENRRVLAYDANDRLQGTLVDFEADDVRDALGRVEPRALAGDRGGALYVADAERDRVLVFDVSGRFARSLGGFGDKPGSFRGLIGVAATRRGGIVTLERAHRRVQRLDPAGTVVATWSAGDGVPGAGLALAVDDSSRVAVADEARGRVDLFDREGRRLATWRGGTRPRALAFAPDGTLLVAEAGAGRLVRLRLGPARIAGRAEP